MYTNIVLKFGENFAIKKNSLVAILFILSFCFSQNVKSAAAIVDTSLLSNIKNLFSGKCFQEVV